MYTWNEFCSWECFGSFEIRVILKLYFPQRGFSLLVRSAFSPNGKFRLLWKHILFLTLHLGIWFYFLQITISLINSTEAMTLGNRHSAEITLIKNKSDVYVQAVTSIKLNIVTYIKSGMTFCINWAQKLCFYCTLYSVHLKIK